MSRREKDRDKDSGKEKKGFIKDIAALFYRSKKSESRANSVNSRDKRNSQGKLEDNIIPDTIEPEDDTKEDKGANVGSGTSSQEKPSNSPVGMEPATASSPSTIARVDSNGNNTQTNRGSPREDSKPITKAITQQVTTTTTTPATPPQTTKPENGKPNDPNNNNNTPNYNYISKSPRIPSDISLSAVTTPSDSGDLGSGYAVSNKKSVTFVPLRFIETPINIETPPPKSDAYGPPEILPEEITYDVSNFIGQGSFGSVYKGVCRGQEVAVKVPKKQKLTVNELNSFRSEVKIMSKIYHPHVVLFLGACTQLGKMQIVTERCFTDMEKFLASDREKCEITLYQRMKMAKDAALGVYWLHSKNGILHLDLKSANLLIDVNLAVKVTDFGFSQIKDAPNDKAKKGTPLWMAPEVMLGLRYNEKADVYSFGIILWEMLTRDVPFAHHNEYAAFYRAVCIEKERPIIPPDTPPSLSHLITLCWDFDPVKRPTFAEIIFRLDVVLIDCLIESEAGRNLWKQNFLLPKQELVENIPWPEFDTVVRNVMGREDINLENLRSLLAQSQVRDPMFNGKETVTAERFDKVTKWFGPFFDPEVGPAVIQEANDLLFQDWFHGDMTREEANERLTKQSQGTFLIRLSSTDPKTAPFTLSLTGNVHRRIRRISGPDGKPLYEIPGKPTLYRSIGELVEKCVDYKLTDPCPKERYNPYEAYSGYNNINRSINSSTERT